MAALGVTPAARVGLETVVDHRLEMAETVSSGASDAGLGLTVSDTRDLPSARSAATRKVPCPSGVAFFERPLSGVDTEIPGATVTIHAISWLAVYRFTPTEHLRPALEYFDWVLLTGTNGRHAWGVLGGGGWSLGTNSDDDVTHSDQISLASTLEDRHRLSALWSIADTPRLTLSENIPPRRAARHRAARAGRPVDQIRVIDARRSHHLTPPQSAGEAPAWTHRWIVGGHWRQQPYGPGRVQRRPTWIAPHVKGPDDKPLVVKENVRVIR